MPFKDRHKRGSVTPFAQLKAKYDYREGNEKPSSLVVRPKPPLYNPYKKYKAGDRVMVKWGKRLVETIIPEVDADGNAIPY